MNLRKSWTRLWARETSNTTATLSAYAKIYTRYTEGHRAYHNLAHIEECLLVFDHYRGLAQDVLIVEAALWWHDFVYDPRATNNEERSAAEARIDMRLMGLGIEFQNKVTSAVMATKHIEGSSPLIDPDEQLVVDIDLSILGANPSRYDKYAADIRKEYSWVPEETYRQKRSEILESFLARKHLFHLLTLEERFDRQARRNLQREIRQLRNT